MYERIRPEAALELLEQGATLFDIRDPESFAAWHHPKARRLDNANVEALLEGLEPQAPVLVCCYHGISSRQVAGYLASRGFQCALSIDGGAEALEAQMESDGQVP